MAKSMTKSQIADHLANKAGITKKTAVQILEDALRQETATGQPAGQPVDDEAGGSA